MLFQIHTKKLFSTVNNMNSAKQERGDKSIFQHFSEEPKKHFHALDLLMYHLNFKAAIW